MILEMAIGAALLLAWMQAGKGKKGELTPERKAIFQAALEVVEDSTKLRELADVFESEGLTVQADLLRKRAALRELPDATKRARHEAFLKAMSASDPRKVDEIADLFEHEGAIGASNALRGYASGLRAGTAAPYMPPPMPPMPPPMPHPAAPPPPPPPAPPAAAKPGAVTAPGAAPPIKPPPAPSAPSAPTGISPAPVVASAGAPPHEVASSASSTGQTIVPATSPSGAVAQTPDNPSGLHPTVGP